MIFFMVVGSFSWHVFSPSGELKRMAAQSKQSFDSSHAFTLYITHEEGRELSLISQLYTSTVLYCIKMTHELLQSLPTALMTLHFMVALLLFEEKLAQENPILTCVA